MITSSPVFLESAVVGYYTLFIFIVLQFISKNGILFALGFLKHFLGYFLGIQTYYCNHGFACAPFIKERIASFNNLFFDSLIEGLWFLIAGSIAFYYIKNKFIAIFLTAFCTHLLSEQIGLHKYYCQNKCI